MMECNSPGVHPGTATTLFSLIDDTSRAGPQLDDLEPQHAALTTTSASTTAGGATRL